MIYAIRHGQTDWNKEGRIQGGGSDQPLNSHGILQAKQLATKLIKLNISTIYSSDLLRAKQTTLEINKILNVKVIESVLLRETDYGELEGQPASVTDTNPYYKKICEAVDAGDHNAHFPSGESRYMAAKRMTEFLKHVNKDENILLSTHGGLLRSFSVLHGGPNQKIPNCGGIQFSLDENNLPENIEIFL